VNTQTTVAAGATSATFTGMPTNGDDYLVTITKGSGMPVAISGNFIDVTVEPYAETWSWSGNTLNLPMPNTRDWRYLYVYEDGVAKSFATTYSSGNKPRIVRGRSTKASLSFTSTATNVSVVMEDYAGNLSTPVYVRGSAGGGSGGGTGSSVTTGGTVTASSTVSPTGEDRAKAFDGSSSTKWLISSSTGWIQYQFASGVSHAVTSYAITSANDYPTRDPKNWTLQGSNDGTSWTTLDTRTSETFASRFQTKTYTFSNTTSYKYYRLNVTANNGGAELQIAEIGLFD